MKIIYKLKDNSVDEFLNSIEKIIKNKKYNENTYYDHISPQYLYIVSDNQIKLDFLFKLEEKDKINNFLKKYNKTFIHSTSNRSLNNLNIVLNKKQKQKIYELYKQDFLFFGYDKILLGKRNNNLLDTKKLENEYTILPIKGSVKNCLLKMKKKIYFLTLISNLQAIEDYINSLNIFDEIINILNFNNYYNTNDIFIIGGQIWLNNSLDNVVNNNNVYFLNVEMLTEVTRMNNLLRVVKKNINIIDYSQSNLTFLQNYLNIRNLEYKGKLLWFPYQFNKKENDLLENKENEYKYDIGIINAVVKKHKSVNSSLEYRRNKIWEKLQSTNLKCVNIMGWREERDKIIKQCKIILNIHHFSCFKIFEHIRCDRLLFANKIIISDKSLHQEDLDIHNFVIWEDYENIIPKAKEILNNFSYNKPNMKIYTNYLINKRKQILNKNLKLIMS